MLATPLLVFAILAADDAPKAKEPLGKDTTYFTGPLDKEGYVDYQAALNEHLGKGITPETNANVLLLKALGPTPEGKRLPAEYFKVMGMEEPPANGAYLIRLVTYLKEHAKLNPTELDAVTRHPSNSGERSWKKQDAPHLVAWLQANEKPLALVVEATRRRDYFNPIVREPSDDDSKSLLESAFFGNTAFREPARALAVRAMLRLGEEKVDEAWQDLLACHRLGRLLARGPTMLHCLIGVSIDGVARRGDLAFLERCDSKQALDCMRELQSLPPMPSMAETFDLGERTMYLDAVQLIRRGKVAYRERVSVGELKKPSAVAAKVLESVDWTPALRKSNLWFDRIVAGMRQPSRAEQQQGFDDIMGDLRRIGQKRESENGFAKLLLDTIAPPKPTGEYLGDTFLLFMLPAMAAGPNALDRVEQSQRNLHIAFALAAFRHDHKRYPFKLDELAPKYLRKVPDDLFAEKPLVYLPHEKGYLLYSVGIDGKDEGGRGNDSDPRGDDLAVQMPLPELKPVKPKTSPLPPLPASKP